MTDEEPRERDQRILDAGALRALAHPLRIQIYDIISQYGPQTASTLAAMTGESSGATSYHLRALAKHDLIREVDGLGTARERWWERPPGSITFTNPDALKTPSGRAATQVVMTEFLNRRHQQLTEFAMTDLAELGDWGEASMISTGTARLTLEQLHALTRRIQKIVDETVDQYRDQEGEGIRPVTIRTDIFPLPEEGH
ncbi:winged helix-turn-helix domain-containing protein [Microbacterium sp. ASV49]|uniref:Helix-turn-helix domain-containing protein n=1 Tax=Microbacterium candidum TaxID=3041922 RepID=A0ABT7MYQ2_9MICO|nr:helix-turn-helix domain-containing protein [Microbacterium sp. ASV49]MDL9979585.1 helix-turn-helix domain-containing protein [Microbacterium sp. ASV49]